MVLARVVNLQVVARQGGFLWADLVLQCLQAGAGITQSVLAGLAGNSA